MQVHIYKGDWGLPSIDHDCLKVISFIKLSKAPVDLIIDNNPYLSPTGFLPYLEGKFAICMFCSISFIIQAFVHNNCLLTDTENNLKVGGNKIIEHLKAQVILSIFDQKIHISVEIWVA
jgi:Outer mitochondrial membrane transport complex protein